MSKRGSLEDYCIISKHLIWEAYLHVWSIIWLLLHVHSPFFPLLTNNDKTKAYCWLVFGVGRNSLIAGVLEVACWMMDGEQLWWMQRATNDGGHKPGLHQPAADDG